MSAPKYRNLSIDQDTVAKIDEIRRELMTQFKKQHGVNMNLSMAETVRIAIKFYADRRSLRGLDPKEISTAISGGKLGE